LKKKNSDFFQFFFFKKLSIHLNLTFSFNLEQLRPFFLKIAEKIFSDIFLWGTTWKFFSDFSNFVSNIINSCQIGIMDTFFQFRVLETFFSEKSWKKFFQTFSKKFSKLSSHLKYAQIHHNGHFLSIQSNWDLFFWKKLKKFFQNFFFKNYQFISNSLKFIIMDTFFQFRAKLKKKILIFFNFFFFKKLSIHLNLTFSFNLEQLRPFFLKIAEKKFSDIFLWGTTWIWLSSFGTPKEENFFQIFQIFFQILSIHVK